MYLDIALSLPLFLLKSVFNSEMTVRNVTRY